MTDSLSIELIPKDVLDRPESTATSLPSSTSTVPPETAGSGPPEVTNGPDGGSKNGSHDLTSPIVGGETRRLVLGLVSSCK